MILGSSYVNDGFIATEGVDAPTSLLLGKDGMGNRGVSNYTASSSRDAFVILFLFSVYLAR